MWRPVGTISLLLYVFSAACGAVNSSSKNNIEGSHSAASETAAGSHLVSDFALKDVNGKSVTLSDYLHKNVIVLSFWAPCCESGREKTIDCQELFETHGKKGLVVLAITADEPEKRGDVRTFVRQRGITVPVLMDVESRVIDQLNPERVLPYTLIIDQSGKIVWHHEGYAPGDKALIEAAVNKILSAQTSA